MNDQNKVKERYFSLLRTFANLVILMEETVKKTNEVKKQIDEIEESFSAKDIQLSEEEEQLIFTTSDIK